MASSHRLHPPLHHCLSPPEKTDKLTLAVLLNLSGIIFQAVVSNILLTVQEKKKEYELLQLQLKMKELVSTLLHLF